ncbi:MAG: DMT family transporter [Deltaproteobacteria bacterium]|nr:DMT family transporter [Deltaproteobacteria bacterium]
MRLLLLLLLMNFCYAGTPAATKLAGLELPPLQIVYLRHTLALLAFLPWFWIQPNKKIAGKDLLTIMLASALTFTLASVLQVFGMRHTHAADGTFIMAMEPIVVIGLAYFFLKEKLDVKTFLGLVLASAGFLIISSPSFNGKMLGNGLLLLATIAEATLPILLKPLLKRYSPVLVAFYCLLFASFYMFPFQGAGFFQRLSQTSPQTLCFVLYLGLACSCLASLLWLTCLSKMTATLVAISWFLQPIFGCLIAHALLGEALTVPVAAGGFLIFLALGVLSTKQKPKPAPVRPTQIYLRIQNPLRPLRPHFPLPSRHFFSIRSSRHELARRTLRPRADPAQRRPLHGTLLRRHHDAGRTVPKDRLDALDQKRVGPRLDFGEREYPQSRLD